MREKLDIGQINTEAFVYEGNKAWFVHSKYNALFEVELNNGKCKYLGYIPQEEIEMPTLYVNIKKYDKYLIMAPFMANDIAVYDIEQQKFIKIKLKTYSSGYLREKFSDLVVYKNNVFFIPMTYPAVVCLNMDGFGLEYIENIVLDAEKRRLNKRYLFNIKPVQQGRTLWLGCFATNCIIEFHLDTHEYIYHEIEDCEKGMSGIGYRNGMFWLIQYPQYKIISWNLETGKAKLYDNFPEKFEGGSYPFSHIVCEEQRILFLPEQANMILMLNPENGTFKGEIRQDEKQKGKIEYGTYVTYNGEVFLIKYNGTIVKIKENLKEKKVCFLYLSVEEINILYNRLSETELRNRKKCRKIMHENVLGESALKGYLKVIVGSEKEDIL